MPLLDLVSSRPWFVAGVVALALFTLAVFALSVRSLRPEHAVVFAVFLYLAFAAERNVLLFAWIAAPLCAVYLDALLGGQRRGVRTAQVAGGLALGLMLAAAAAVHGQVVSRFPHSGLSPFRFGEGAVEYLARYPVPGAMFNSDRAGGYALWRLYPPKRVFMDGRFALRTTQTFTDYLRAFDSPAYFETVRARYDITHALVQTAVFDRYMPLAAHLYRSPAWSLAYADGSAALFVLKPLCVTAPLDLSDPATVSRLERQVRQRWSACPAVQSEALRHLQSLVGRLCPPSH